MIKEVSGNMIELMSQDPDPKFQNSQFLQFLAKLKSGEYAIKDKQLIVNPEIQTQNLENAFKSAEKFVEETKINPQEEEKLQAAWSDAEMTYEAGASKEEIDKIFENAWKEAAGQINQNELREEMEREYKQLLESMDLKDKESMNDILAEAWQIGQDIEEAELYDDPDPQYQFMQANPFENHPNPLETAIDSLTRGCRLEAIAALESHLQKNPKDARAWRMLGRLHQDNDQDRKALPCFLVNEIDAFNDVVTAALRS